MSFRTRRLSVCGLAVIAAMSFSLCLPINTAKAQNAAGTTTTQASSTEPNLVSAKIEFIPGEKTIFFDDFSDMPPGEPPPHWKVRDDPVELRIGGGIRQLTITGNSFLTAQPISLPKNFTLEMEVSLPNGTGQLSGVFSTADDDTVYSFQLDPNPGGDENQINVTVADSSDTLGSREMPADLSKPVTFDLWVQEGRMRAYLNGQRAVDANQIKLGTAVKLELHPWNQTDQPPEGIRSIRIAESAPDPGATLASTGKYVTHGIYFDSDSDLLKPESAPVIKAISHALYANSGMKLEVDGYTDSTGNAAHNLDLSKRRAAAVMKVLVSQFGIDQGRLTSNGFGAAKPIASNDTPTGRAQNRRVEFVKQ